MGQRGSEKQRTFDSCPLDYPQMSITAGAGPELILLVEHSLSVSPEASEELHDPESGEEPCGGSMQGRQCEACMV